MELPYRAEYSKSSRANCKQCKSPILKDSLRMACMIQSPFFDGRQANWYHFHCFFAKPRVKTVDDIEHFESLRIEDQDKIREKVGAGSGAVILPDEKKKGKKRTVDKAKKDALQVYKIEYAKSGRAMCRGCEQKILKDEIRISKKDFETEVGMKYGGQDMWHHVSCFAQVRSELGYFETAEMLPGFKSLKKDDQKDVLKQIPAIKQEDVPIKKVKKEEDDPKEKEYREQNTVMFKYRDDLKMLNKNEMATLFRYNKQEVPVGEANMLDRLSDIMTFGAIEPCTNCKGGQFVFNKFGYICQGDLSEWTKCQLTTKEVKRKPFKVPKDLKSVHSFLKKYKYVKRDRIFRDIHPSVAPVKKEVKDEVDAGPKVQRALPPLYNMTFVILSCHKKTKDELKKDIASLGGKVVTKIDKTIMAVISDQDMVDKMGARIRMAEENDVHVVPEDFLDEAKENTGKIPDLIIKKSICNWGSDPATRLPPEPSSSAKSKSGSYYTKSVPSKIKLKLKDGNAVDPDSGLEDVAHVFEEYNAVLGLTDIQSNKNSYYKLQVLKHDSQEKYYLFRAWGRIGTTVGGTKLDNFHTSYEAVDQFRNYYEEKSGNKWEFRKNFVKIPGRMYPIDIDYGEDATKGLEIVESESKLPRQVQDLMKVIFDVNSMKKVMAEFELDTDKMPLGKLSKNQISKAYTVLTELQQLVESNAVEPKLIDATNRFYTLIPHSFGVNRVEILRDLDLIKQKVEMLDSLLEMEIAYNLMNTSSGEHTVDTYYTQLKAEITPLDKNTDEFKIIEEYVKNTHAETHRNYDLVIEEVFILKRQGEEKRFKPFKKLHNRKLLWHGSRVTNYVGIISQGLRIAPPEAPSTGYMFGKGIYFADMVSKSANYCATHHAAPTGLMLLSEVALGDMHELDHAKYVEKAPKGSHSVKGRGRTHPDPSVVKTLHEGVVVPLGKGVPNPEAHKSSLLYNEYIVYDVAQVNIKYLLKMRFAYKY